MAHAKIQHDLTADDSQLKSKLAKAKSVITSYATSTKKALKSAAMGFAAIWAAAMAGAGVALKLFATQERAEKKLEAVIKATGGAAGWSADQMKEMAKDMQAVTGAADEVTISNMGVLATFKEIKGDQFKEAMMAAEDMAAVLDVDAKGAVIQLGKALNDPIKGMAALSRSGVSFTQQQKDQVKAMQSTGDIVGAQKIILAELKGEFGGAAAAMADTFGGRVKDLKNRLGDLGEQIGGALAPAMDGFIAWLQNAAGWVENNMDSIKGFIAGFTDLGKTVMEYVIPVFTTLLKFYAGYWAAVETFVMNFKVVFTTAMTAVAYQAVKSFNIVVHFIGTVIPDLLAYFIRNWRSIFLDAFNYTSYIFENMLKNIAGFFSAVWSYFKGDGFDYKWTALSDGFISTLEELPKIAERVPGDLEQALGSKLGKLGSKLSGEFNKNYQKKLKQFGLVDAPGAPEISGDNLNNYGGPADQSGRKYEPAAAKKKKEKSSAAAAFEGVDALYKRIASASAKRPEDRTANATEKMAGTMDKTYKETLEMRKLAAAEAKKAKQAVLA